MSAWVGRISRQGRGRDCSASSSNPMMEGPPGADSEEKHEPVSDIDTVVVDSLKALDPEWPIREADMSQTSPNRRDRPSRTWATSRTTPRLQNEFRSGPKDLQMLSPAGS